MNDSKFQTGFLAIENPEEQRYIQVTLYIVLGAATLTSSVLLIASFIMHYPALTLTMGIGTGLELLVLVLIWQDHLRLPRLLMPLATFALASYTVLIGGGFHDDGLFAYPATIVMAGLLLGKYGVIFYTLLSAVSISALGVAEIMGIVKNDFSHLTEPLNIVVYCTLLGLMGMLLYVTISNLTRNLNRARHNEQKLSRANQELINIHTSLEDTIAERTRNAEEARVVAEAAQRATETQVWLIAGQARLAEQMRGEQDRALLAHSIIRQLCEYLGAQVGALYGVEGEQLRLWGSYAYVHRKQLSNTFGLGEGLVGQAALEKHPITLQAAPADYVVVRSGLGEASPRYLLALPILYEQQVIGVIELASFAALTPEQIQFLEAVQESIAIAFHTAQTRSQIDHLLARTQKQAETLQIQGEELRAANEELEAQTESLRVSQSRLREQQGALEAANAELEEKALAQQEQQLVLDRQNQELRAAQTELERKAEELARASRYKSEFLANMSHELRTPLNSLLILARLLANNEEGNLTPEQVESANVIYNSGSDLLDLINEILDLSKVEAGKMELRLETVSFGDLLETLRAQFAPVAESKGLALDFVLAEGTPAVIETDGRRVEQILKNLLANALKFTEKGRVQCHIHRPPPGAPLPQSGLEPARAVALSVTDTGIGMTPEQQALIFEAFRQADGSISRKYGGTGLGLTISRLLAQNLGGEITLTSEYGRGSTFTLYLPLAGPREAPPAQKREAAPPPHAGATAQEGQGVGTPPPPAIFRPPPAPAPPLSPARVPDDREAIQPGDRVLLVVEDDANFAKVVRDFGRRQGFKCVIALDGQTGLNIVKHYPPDAIILDLNLPVVNGWTVLDALKEDPATRHIPVHIMSVDDANRDAYQRGAIGFLTKPVSPEALEASFQHMTQFITREIKSLLVVEDEVNLRWSMKKLLEGDDVFIVEAGTGQAALTALQTQPVDCMILDLSLPDMSGFELLRQMNTAENTPRCPVIIYTGQALTEEENLELMKYTDAAAQPPRVIIKGVRSPERLLDETALFLHRIVADMPEEKQKTIRRLHDKKALLAGKHVLIVDDDMRGAYALSKALGAQGLEVSLARSGAKALEFLQGNVKIDLILMDIMMPEMDGYETIRQIRAQRPFRDLPILALTAKAMKGDQEKSIAAGASDYLSKPVDLERLLSMLRVWLYQ